MESQNTKGLGIDVATPIFLYITPASGYLTLTQPWLAYKTPFSYTIAWGISPKRLSTGLHQNKRYTDSASC